MRKRTAQKFTFKNQTNKEGFTLIELLVVIAIIAIIAAVVAILINPIELTKRGRDSNRVSDLANLQQAINVAGEENAAATNIMCGGTPAVPGTITNCGGSNNASGVAYSASTPGSGAGTSTAASGARALDGTGWVKVNLTSVANVLQTPTLPIDPQNTAALHYTFCGVDPASPGNPTYQISTILESAQQSPKMANDGGNDTALYDVGSNLNLMKTASGLTCQY